MNESIESAELLRMMGVDTERIGKLQDKGDFTVRINFLTLETLIKVHKMSLSEAIHQFTDKISKQIELEYLMIDTDKTFEQVSKEVYQ